MRQPDLGIAWPCADDFYPQPILVPHVSVQRLGHPPNVGLLPLLAGLGAGWLTLCSVPQTIKALRDMRRVLKPGGELIFCEHGAAPEPNVRRWQERLNPIWQIWAGGCRLNLRIPDLLEEGGFKIRALDRMYINGPKFASYNYLGTAV